MIVMDIKDSKDMAKEIFDEVQDYIEKFRDPIFLGTLFYKVLEERENTNRLLKEMNRKYEALLERLAALEARLDSPGQQAPPALSPVDEQILDLLRARGLLSAEEVRKALGYKGKNAASQRLNRLFSLGLVEKIHKGKKVYFRAK